MNSEINETKKGKNGIILAVCVIAVCAVIAACFFLLGNKDSGAAIEYRDPNGVVTASVDQKFMSLMMGIINYQYGTDSLAYEAWDEDVLGDGNTLRDYFTQLSTQYAQMLLKSEYISDYIYGIGFSDEQKEDVDDKIESYISSYGSEDMFENYLSAYGTDIGALRRFMELSAKQNTLMSLLYDSITDEEKAEYFANNYYIADHVMIKLEGEKKDDGTVTPLTSEQRAEKIAYANGVFNEIRSGLRDFDTAVYEIGEDTYKLAFPDGYFIPKSGNSNLDAKVIDNIRTMKDGEMRLVETEKAVFIVRKNKMDGNLCLASADFSGILASTLAQNEFLMQCEAVADAVVIDEVMSQLDPSVIAPFDIDSLGK